MSGRLINIGLALSVLFSTVAPFTAAQAAVSIPFTVNLSESVLVTGTPRVAVDVGGVTRYALYSGGTGTNALTFTLSPQAGDIDLDGVTVSSPIDLNGGAIKDTAGNDASLTFTPPNTSGIKIDYPSLGMDFGYDADGRYTLNGTVYNDLTSFLAATGGTFSRASIGTYYDSSGTLQTAASGVSRFDWDPVTHAAKGILIEESRTNLAKNSENISAWSNNTTLTISSDTMIAPNGTMTADTTSSVGSTRYITASVIIGTKYTYSFYIKPTDPSNNIQLYVDGVGGTGYCRIVPSTGAIAGTSGTYNSAGTINVGNGWYRLFMVFTPIATGSEAIHIYPIKTDLTGWWGAQLEAGSFPTSYIPTTSASVTRAADDLVIPTGGWFSSTDGAVFAQASVVDTVLTNLPTIVSIDGGASTNRIQVRRSNSAGLTNLAMVAGGTTIFSSSGGTSWTDSQLHKISMGYKSAANALFLDGILQYSYTTPSALPTMSEIRLGQGLNVGYIDGSLYNFRYYPSRVSDTQLQLLTQ